MGSNRGVLDRVKKTKIFINWIELWIHKKQSKLIINFKKYFFLPPIILSYIYIIYSSVTPKTGFLDFRET